MSLIMENAIMVLGWIGVGWMALMLLALMSFSTYQFIKVIKEGDWE